MTKIINPSPAKALLEAVKKLPFHKCALVVIDEDEPFDKNIEAEIDVVKACARTLMIPAFLFYIKQIPKGDPNKKPRPENTADLAKQESTTFFNKENQLQANENKGKGLINKSILEAAGPTARIFRKYRNSCFGDHAKAGSDIHATVEQLKESTLHKTLFPMGVTNLIVSGRYRSSCVLGTCTHGAMLGYSVFTASTIIFGPTAEGEDWFQNPKIQFFAPN